MDQQFFSRDLLNAVTDLINSTEIIEYEGFELTKTSNTDIPEQIKIMCKIHKPQFHKKLIDYVSANLELEQISFTAKEDGGRVDFIITLGQEKTLTLAPDNILVPIALSIEAFMKIHKYNESDPCYINMQTLNIIGTPTPKQIEYLEDDIKIKYSRLASSLLEEYQDSMEQISSKSAIEQEKFYTELLDRILLAVGGLKIEKETMENTFKFKFSIPDYISLDGICGFFRIPPEFIPKYEELGHSSPLSRHLMLNNIKW